VNHLSPISQAAKVNRFPVLGSRLNRAKPLILAASSCPYSFVSPAFGCVLISIQTGAANPIQWYHLAAMKIFGGSQWTRNDVLTLLSLLVATIIGLLTVKEFRELLGLEKHQAVIIKNYQPQPSPFPTITRPPVASRQPTPKPIVETTPVPLQQQSNEPRATPQSAPGDYLTPPIPRPSPKPEPEPGVYSTDSNTLRAQGMRKVGDYATMTLILEGTGEKPSKFMMGDCYALDENGVRWEQKDRYENRFTWGFGNELIPDTKQRIEMRFTTSSSDSGSVFTLSCAEVYPQGDRRIIIRKIAAR